MLSRLKLLYIDADLLSPDEFPRIVSPSSACHTGGGIASSSRMEYEQAYNGAAISIDYIHDAGV